jgi:hypothetical protein
MVVFRARSTSVKDKSGLPIKCMCIHPTNQSRRLSSEGNICAPSFGKLAIQAVKVMAAFAQLAPYEEEKQIEGLHRGRTPDSGCGMICDDAKG